MPPKNVVKKPVYKIDGEEITIDRTPLQKNSKITSVMITAKTTSDSVKAGKNEAVDLDYDDVKKFVDTHRKMLFGNGKKIQINIFGNQGWRAGFAFTQGDNVDWFSVRDQYKETEEIQTVFAIQILIF